MKNFFYFNCSNADHIYPHPPAPVSPPPLPLSAAQFRKDNDGNLLWKLDSNPRFSDSLLTRPPPPLLFSFWEIRDGIFKQARMWALGKVKGGGNGEEISIADPRNNEHKGNARRNQRVNMMNSSLLFSRSGIFCLQRKVRINLYFHYSSSPMSLCGRTTGSMHLGVFWVWQNVTFLSRMLKIL